MEGKRIESATSQIKIPIDEEHQQRFNHTKNKGSAYFSHNPYSAYGQRAKMSPELGTSRLPFNHPESTAFRIRAHTYARTFELQQEIERKKQSLNLIESENKTLMTKLMNNSTLAKKLDAIKTKMESFPKAEERVKRKMLKVHSKGNRNLFGEEKRE